MTLTYGFSDFTETIVSEGLNQPFLFNPDTMSISLVSLIESNRKPELLLFPSIETQESLKLNGIENESHGNSTRYGIVISLTTISVYTIVIVVGFLILRSSISLNKESLALLRSLYERVRDLL